MTAREHQVVVVLDITAPDRLSAARAALGLLNGTRGRFTLQDGTHASTTVESWWFPEAELKQVDRNDNATMHLEPDAPPLDVYVEDDAEDTPTVWLHNHDDPERPEAILCSGTFGRHGSLLLWDHIVRGLPTSPPAVPS